MDVHTTAGRQAQGVDRPLLLVEDEAPARQGTRELLEREGYAVVEAAHGLDALELLAGGLRPALVLLDLMTPEVDGWEVLRQLRAEPALASLPVLVVSAAREPRAAGATAVLCKPFGAADLLRLVAAFAGPVAAARPR